MKDDLEEKSFEPEGQAEENCTMRSFRILSHVYHKGKPKSKVKHFFCVIRLSKYHYYYTAIRAQFLIFFTAIALLIKVFVSPSSETFHYFALKIIGLTPTPPKSKDAFRVEHPHMCSSDLTQNVAFKSQRGGSRRG